MAAYPGVDIGRCNSLLDSAAEGSGVAYLALVAYLRACGVFGDACAIGLAGGCYNGGCGVGADCGVVPRGLLSNFALDHATGGCGCSITGSSGTDGCVVDASGERDSGVAARGAGGGIGDSASGARSGVSGFFPVGVRSGEGVKKAEGKECDPLDGLTGRQRRKKKRAMKKQASGEASEVVGSSGEGKDTLRASKGANAPGVEASSASVERGEERVPEWRRKDAKALVHKGYFSECSPEVRKELKETRAQMMIARNRAAVAKAKEEAVRSEAAVKSRQVEQQAELRRLQTEAKLKKALESKFGVGMKSGFAETVVSNGLEEVCGTPSLSDGSVSPNSSISVCAVRKMEQTIKDLAEKVRDLQRENDVLLGKKEKGNGKEKSDEDYDGPISEAEYRRNCDIMYGMRPGATKPMDAKYDELMVKMCAEGFSALGTEDLNELQAYGEFYG